MAIGNLIAGAVLAAGGYALPVRFWPLDVALGSTLVTLIGSSVAVLVKAPWSDRALRVAAWALLLFGLLLTTVLALGMGFLSGVHGEFGSMGALVMGLVLALIVPYAVAYPALQLTWAFRRRSRGAPP